MSTTKTGGFLQLRFLEKTLHRLELFQIFLKLLRGGLKFRTAGELEKVNFVVVEKRKEVFFWKLQLCVLLKQHL